MTDADRTVAKVTAKLLGFSVGDRVRCSHEGAVGTVVRNAGEWLSVRLDPGQVHGQGPWTYWPEELELL